MTQVMYYEILGDNNTVINRIVADKEYVERRYPDRYVEVGPYREEQASEEPESDEQGVTENQ